jgi:shikimate kinase
MVRTIAIGGFMGVGKTTAGRELADRLSVPFVDLDERIAADIGMPISEIFSQRGEKAFREIESVTLAAVLKGPPLVLALGGGTLHLEENRTLLQTSLVVCLLMQLKNIRTRVGDKSPSRPLWAEAESLYQSRLVQYETEEYLLRVDDMSTTDVVNRLEDLIQCA